LKQIVCKDAQNWHDWLEKNHDSEKEIWLVFFKGTKAKRYINYDQALDVALCFGWIDTLIKRIDDEKYRQRFSKRKEKSKWSPGNKARVERLISEGRMTSAGYAVVNASKMNGSWDKPDRPEVEIAISSELRKALKRFKPARQYFDSLTPSQRTRYIMWIATAKKTETIEKRVKDAIELLRRKQTLGRR